MAYRWRPKNAEVDADNPRAWATCDRCGWIHNLHKLQFQYAYQGSSQPQNTRFLVCTRCLDPLNPQSMPYILSPDPMPVFNARPGASDLYGEASYLVAEDESILTTEGGDSLITPIPDPTVQANTTNLLCTIEAPGGDVSVAYLDLFDGDPSSGGRSVLSAITGSATRTNISGDLTTTAGVATNTEPIIVSSASKSQTNVNWCGLYSASISGALLMSGRVSVTPFTIAEGNPVRFNTFGLSINLN
jgi:hypothetical protein